LLDWWSRQVESLPQTFDKHLCKIAVAAALLLLPNYQLYDLEANLSDVQVKAKYLLADWSLPQQPPEVAFVGIDDWARRGDRLGRLNRLPPLSRTYLAEVVRAAAAARSRVLLVDVFLDTPAEAASDDETLAAAIQEATAGGVKVVIPCRLARDGSAEIPVLPIDRYVGIDGVFFGHAHMVASAVDGAIRMARVANAVPLTVIDRLGLADQLLRYLKMPQRRQRQDQFLFWSMPGAAIGATDAAQAQALLENGASDEFRIDFTRPRDQVYARYSSAELLAGRVAGAKLESRVVVIGVAHEESADRHPTPLSVRSLPAGRIWAAEPVLDRHLTGAEIQSYAVDTLRRSLTSGRNIHDVSTGWMVFLSGLAGAVVAMLFRRRRRWWAILAVAVPFAYAIGAIAAFQATAVYLPVLRPAAAYLLIAAFGRSVLLRVSKTYRRIY
jgi:CHASE2 domain-containing sensor protein